MAYQRKVTLNVQDTLVPVCDLCAPQEVAVPLEVRTERLTVSTGMFRIELDWDQELPGVRTHCTLRRKSVWSRIWGAVRAWFRREA